MGRWIEPIELEGPDATDGDIVEGLLEFNDEWTEGWREAERLGISRDTLARMVRLVRHIESHSAPSEHRAGLPLWAHDAVAEALDAEFAAS